MRSLKQLHAAIGAGVWINGDEGRGHIWKQAAILIPVTVVLMPGPRAAGERLLDAHLGVVMVNLIAQELLHRINQPMAARHRAIEVFTSLVPKNKFCRAAFPIFEIIRAIFESSIG